MQLYGVLGNPIAQSRSPEIHALFAKSCNLDIEYNAYCLTIGEFENELAELRAEGILGTNVTMPFKENAYRLSNVLTTEAEEAGAVNTLKFEGDVVTGHNTDGNGIVKDLLERHNVTLKDQRILVLGAGGATKGILGPLLRENPSEIVISNRTYEKAEQLAKDFASLGNIHAVPWDQLVGRFDLIINATSSSFSNEFTALPCEIDENTLGYDLAYSTKPTAFMEYLTANGSGQVWDGFGMLVEQAALSFEFWHGIKPETETVYQDLRQILLSCATDY